MAILETIFGPQGHISVWQELARAVVIFVFGFVLVRVGGRRLFGRWSALDIVVSIMIGSNLSRTLTGSAPFAGTLLATAVLILLHWLLAQAAARSEMWSRILEGHLILLGQGGKLQPHTMKTHGVSRADIDEALRGRGMNAVEETSEIALEPSGKIQPLRQGS